MKLKHLYHKYENQIIAAGFLIMLGILVGIRYDYYYDLNDDVVIKDILAGVYTGEPESHNIQMLYPISLFISLCYRIVPKAPVYGIFLCLCQFGCFYFIIERSMTFKKNTCSKLLLAALEGLVLVLLFLEHFIFIQYTVTCTLLAATAAFLFITTDNQLPVREFIRKNIISILLVITAFCIRTEMLLLVLPLICVAGIYKWAKESPVFTKENTQKYLSIIGGILVGIMVMYGVNAVAYSSQDWKEFLRYFDSRTELYDFQGLPSYEENKELYDKLGIKESEQNMLFDQYNFGIDDTIDAGILDAMSSHQAQIRKENISFTEKFAEKIKEYRYRMIHKEPAGTGNPDDYPYNIMVIVGYLLVFTVALCNRIGSGEKVLSSVWNGGWQLLLLGLTRTVLWLFILIRERDPIRITHSLYIMEICILWAMLQIECRENKTKVLEKIKLTHIFQTFIAIITVLSLSEIVKEVDLAYTGRENANITTQGISEYCRKNSENFYFIDVYSFVSDPVTSIFYSEKIFKNVNNKQSNYDIMGGWLSKSPLYEKKMKTFQIHTMQESLVYNDNVYMMLELQKDTEDIVEYYKDQDIVITTELVDTINEVIGVYKIQTISEPMK